MSKRFDLVALVAVTALAAACGSPGGSGDDDPTADAGVDAPPGVGCTAMSPRTTPPETFVGPVGLEDRLSHLLQEKVKATPGQSSSSSAPAFGLEEFDPSQEISLGGGSTFGGVMLTFGATSWLIARRRMSCRRRSCL